MSEAQCRPLECVIGNSTLRLEYCDITTLNVDVMVSSDDIYLSMGGGVSYAFLRAGGETVWRQTKAQAPIKLGNMAITTAGELPSKRIFHAAVLDYERRDLTTIDLIRRVTRKCLSVCNEQGFRSIAFPALATGVAGLSPERCAVAMMIEIATYLSSITNIELVVVVLYPGTGLPRDVLARFYSQVSDFLELIQRLESMTVALGHLEAVYRELKLGEEAKIAADSRESLRCRRYSWEKAILERKPEDFRRERAWRNYREEIETELYKVGHLGEGEEQLINLCLERGQSENLEKYREFRSATLRQIILIRQKNITDLELEQAKLGFSVQINRKLEHERNQLNKIKDELKKL